MSASLNPGAFNSHGVWAIYKFEMARALRTLWGSLVTPVITTSLYFVVFGSAIGSRMTAVEGVSYGAFIVPGLIMLSLFTTSIFNASFGIYFPKFTGTIYELLSAPVSYLEIVLAYVGAAATKSVILGLVILATAALFVPLKILHPFWMIAFLILTSTTFSLFGFIIGVWAKGFEQLQVIPMLIVTPLTFLGGAFYTIDMLPPTWRAISLFNPVVYLIGGFRWAFYETSDVGVGVCLAMTLGFFGICLVVVSWMFKTGYRLKTERLIVTLVDVLPEFVRMVTSSMGYIAAHASASIRADAPFAFAVRYPASRRNARSNSRRRHKQAAADTSC